MRLTRRWHRHRIAGWRINWYFGTAGNYGYGWKWFRRDRLVDRPANWTGNFGQLMVRVWAPRKERSDVKV